MTSNTNAVSETSIDVQFAVSDDSPPLTQEAAEVGDEVQPLAPPSDKVRQEVVNAKLEYINFVLNERDPGSRDLGQYSERYRSLLNAFKEVHLTVLFERMKVRGQLSEVLQDGSSDELSYYEVSLSSLEVVVADLIGALELKKKLSIRDIYVPAKTVPVEETVTADAQKSKAKRKAQKKKDGRGR